MNIKDIINAERWWISADPAKSAHNACLDRIYEAVSDYIEIRAANYDDIIEKQDARIDELEAQLDIAKTAAEISVDGLEAAKRRIGDLEAALSTIMDEYQYRVCFDENFEKASKVLRAEIGQVKKRKR